MVGERGALEGIEPQHCFRENGLECSDHLSVGTDICKYVDYGNVFRKHIIETLRVNKGRVVGCIMIEWGQIQTHLFCEICGSLPMLLYSTCVHSSPPHPDLPAALAVVTVLLTSFFKTQKISHHMPPLQHAPPLPSPNSLPINRHLVPYKKKISLPWLPYPGRCGLAR